MKRLYPVVILAALVAACADEPTSPVQTQARSYSAAAAGSTRHIVAFNSTNGVPSDFVAAVEALGGKVVSEISPIGGAVVSGLDAAAVASLSARGDVSDVQLEGLMPYGDRTVAQPEAVSAVAPVSTGTPNTAAIFARQWNMRAVNAPAAWSQGRLGSPTVVAAILDTGIDYTLPDLAGLVDVANSKSFIPEDDALLAAVFPGTNPISDLDGHGSNVATQVSSNAVYFAGVTSKTTLLGVKVCSLVLDGCPWGAILDGIVYAVDQGADVINMSLGGSFPLRQNGAFNSLLNRVFQYAEQNGVTVVVSAGNASADMDHSPNVHFNFCDQTHVICVSAVGATASGPTYTGPFNNPDQFAFYSNFGRSGIDVAAPGGNYTLTPLGDAVASAAWVWSLCSRTSLVIDEGTVFYTNCSYPPYIAEGRLYTNGYAGTSQASPHVAGLAALLASETGSNPAQIRRRIAEGADRIGKGGNDAQFGAGRINVGNTH